MIKSLPFTKVIVWMMRFVLLCAILMITTGLSIILAPALESRYMPVVTGMNFNVIESADAADKSSIYMRVTGSKVRNCEFKSVSTLVSDHSLLAAKGRIRFLSEGNMDDNSLPTTRPVGLQSFGTWAIQPPGDRFIIQFRHSCHPGWDTTTQIEVQL